MDTIIHIKIYEYNHPHQNVRINNPHQGVWILSISRYWYTFEYLFPSYKILSTSMIKSCRFECRPHYLATLKYKTCSTRWSSHLVNNAHAAAPASTRPWESAGWGPPACPGGAPLSASPSSPRAARCPASSSPRRSVAAGAGQLPVDTHFPRKLLPFLQVTFSAVALPFSPWWMILWWRSCFAGVNVTTRCQGGGVYRTIWTT